MTSPVYLPDRITASVTVEIAEAVRARAAASGLTVADYVRRGVQDRLARDGAQFEFLPDLQRVTSRRAPPRTY